MNWPLLLVIAAYWAPHPHRTVSQPSGTLMRRILSFFARPAGHHRRTRESVAQMEDRLDQAHSLIRRLEKRANQLDAADRLIATLVEQRDGLQIENDALRDAYDELFARYQDAEQHLRMVSRVCVPAPVDDQPTIRLYKYDPDATVETRVTALQDALGLGNAA